MIESMEALQDERAHHRHPSERGQQGVMQKDGAQSAKRHTERDPGWYEENYVAGQISEIAIDLVVAEAGA